jgi:hypothetical protein
MQFGLANNYGAEIDESLHIFCCTPSWVMELQPGTAAYRGLEACNVKIILDNDSRTGKWLVRGLLEVASGGTAA